ncbi:MAG: hypothetical protein U0V74_06425 [Chitinophagales bacterium]
MGQKKELKKLKKRLKSIEKDMDNYRSKTEKQFSQLETLLSEFNQKLTDVLNLRKASANGNGTTHKKPVKK